MPSSTSSSEPPQAPDAGGPIGGPVQAQTPIDGLVHADALEEAHRTIPERPWGRIALIALVLLVAMMAGWEGFWRHQGYYAGDIKDSDAAWADLFDIDLDVWQKTTGVRPVQLSLEGTSPRFMLKELADDPNFHGLVVADIVSGLFWGSFGGRSESVLPYYRHETPSQRAGFYLSLIPENLFAYIDDQTRPKELWRRLNLPLRPGQPPLFVDPYKIGIKRADRNSEMWDRELNDTAYRERSTRIWSWVMAPPPGAPPPDPPKVIAEVAANVAKIRAKGGDVVFVQHPQAGWLQDAEPHAFPRAKFWDPLMAGAHTRGVRWEDYPQLKGFRIPEISHMHPRDAEVYTSRLAPMVMAAHAEGPPKP
jgi:hypothetical protein